ncbi:MAG: hypothetical protein MMC23_010164 [Stictis urceolatum]|nr:hypothetical protein [Stictis urceolata]
MLTEASGGRTAWSSTVTIPSSNSTSQRIVQARYWYDGQYVHNAKEDAAEVALRILTGGSPSSPINGSGGGGTSTSSWTREAASGSQSIYSVNSSNAVGIGAAWPRAPAGR